MDFLRLNGLGALIGGAVCATLAVAAYAAVAGSGGYKLGILVPPGPFHGIHGTNFGPDGTLYGGDIVGMTVHAIDVKTGKHRVVVGPPEGMADDVAIAPPGTPHAGTLVWSGVAVGRLYARDPDGHVRMLADKLPGINSVVFAPDGRLFVAQMAPGNNVLWQWDLTDPAQGGQPPQKLWDETYGLNSFVVRENALFGPQGEKGTIVRFDLGTHEIKVLASGLKWPTGVKMDSKGRLFAVDLEGGTVHRVDVEAGTAPVIATLEPGLDNLTVGPDDQIYVSSITRNGVFKINPDTGVVQTVVRGALSGPGGMAISAADPAHGYIADLFTLRGVDLQSGAVSIVIPMTAASPYPTNVTAHAGTAGDHLIVTSWFTGKLLVLDRASGRTLREEKGLNAPHDAVELDDGTLLVTETGAGRLVRIAPDGARTPLPVAASEPVGLAVASAEAAFVTDAWAGAVLRVDLKTWRGSTVAKGLRRPEGIAVRGDGALLVVDSLARSVLAVDPASGATTVVARDLALGLEAPPPLKASWIHNGIAVGANGVVYLPSDKRTAVYTLTPRL